ncbi:UNVERIFIED_CONTAM: hypothetical protein Sindi_2869600 [Sesamum indicum]
MAKAHKIHPSKKNTLTSIVGSIGKKVTIPRIVINSRTRSNGLYAKVTSKTKCQRTIMEEIVVADLEAKKEDLEKEMIRDQGTWENAPVKGIIHTIAGGSAVGYSRRSRKKFERKSWSLKNRQILSITPESEITFGAHDARERIGKTTTPWLSKWTLPTSLSIKYWWITVLAKMGLDNANLIPVKSPLVGFSGSEVESLGTIELPVSKGEEPKRKTLMGETIERKRKFTESNKNEWEDRRTERIEPIDEHRKIELVQGDSTKTTKIWSGMEKGLETMMIAFLHNNVDMFAWNPEVIVLRLNVDPTIQLVQQKKRTFGAEKNRIINDEVNKLLKAGYIYEIQHTDWLSNVVVVPKPSGKWRM